MFIKTINNPRTRRHTNTANAASSKEEMMETKFTPEKIKLIKGMLRDRIDTAIAWVMVKKIDEITLCGSRYLYKGKPFEDGAIFIDICKNVSDELYGGNLIYGIQEQLGRIENGAHYYEREPEKKQIHLHNNSLREENNLPAIKEILDHAIYKAMSDAIRDEEIGEIVINDSASVLIDGWLYGFKFLYKGKLFEDSPFLSDICMRASEVLKSEASRIVEEGIAAEEARKQAIKTARQIGDAVSNHLAGVVAEEMDKIVSELIKTGTLQDLNKFCNVCSARSSRIKEKARGSIRVAVLRTVGLYKDREESDSEKDRRKRAYYLLECEDAEYRKSDIH